jgi:hypothetical protein
MDDELLGKQSAIAEARALYEMAMRGTESVAGIRGLIVVPAKMEQALRAYAQAHPEEKHLVDSALMFRQAVLAEFNRLVSDGVPVNQSPLGETAVEQPAQISV